MRLQRRALGPVSPQRRHPPQVWVTIAAKLNYDIVKLNEDKTA